VDRPRVRTTEEKEVSQAPVEWKESAGFEYAGAAPLQYAMTQPGVILHYLRLAFWPDNLCLDYGWPSAPEYSIGLDLKPASSAFRTPISKRCGRPASRSRMAAAKPLVRQVVPGTRALARSIARRTLPISPDAGRCGERPAELPASFQTHRSGIIRQTSLLEINTIAGPRGGVAGPFFDYFEDGDAGAIELTRAGGRHERTGRILRGSGNGAGARVLGARPRAKHVETVGTPPDTIPSPDGFCPYRNRRSARPVRCVRCSRLRPTPESAPPESAALA
jgi:hypothetical protein